MKDITPPNNKRSIRNVVSPRFEDGPAGDSVSGEDKKENNVRKIHDFKVPLETENDIPEESHDDTEDTEDRDNASRIYSPLEKKKNKKTAWWIGGMALGLGTIMVLGFGISSQFATAEVTITPISKKADIDKTLTVYKEPSAQDIGFDIISINTKKHRQATLEATGEERIEEKATGMITVYNEFSESQQVLITNTRFKSPEGLIFRIQGNLTVPGMSGGEPGTVRTNVYADEVGSNYNIGPTRFTIPGFEGMPQFEGIYARSETPMTGGGSGTIPIVDENDLEQVRFDIREGIKEELLSEVERSVPGGFLMLKGAYTVEESEKIRYENGKAVLEMNAVLHGVILKEEDLVGHLYKETFDEEKHVEIKNWERVTFEPEDTHNLYERDEITFTVSGDVDFYQRIDKELLSKNLAGLSVRDTERINLIINQSENPIVEAKISISPFWMPYLPSNPERIKITTEH